MRRLDGRVALITGGASGIGRACCERSPPVAFPASDDASFVTGHALVVDGGFTAGTRSPRSDFTGIA